MAKKGPEPGKTTLKDVAAAAGVSIATVSYVLNKKKPIGVEKTKRVLDSVERLGYRPSKHAIAMRTGRSGDIGLVLPDLTTSYFAALAESVTLAAAQRGSNVYLISTNGLKSNERTAIESLSKGGVDGVIWFPNFDEDTYSGAPMDLPVVVIDRNLAAYDVVHADYRRGGMLAAQFLCSKGHHKIGLIEGPQNISSSFERSAGFTAALSSHADLLWRIEHGFRYDIEHAALKLIAQKDVTAIMCGNDTIAIGVLRVLRQLGIACPQAISVMGFNDTQMSALVYPSLTTVKMPIQEMGFEAVDILTSRIANRAGTRRRCVLDVCVVERESA
ncbi:MAG: LacI family DNA-binding transcriptional regulator [Pseudomonadota bacterium]